MPAATRTDKFGDLGDVHGVVEHVDLRQLPRHCVNALQAGLNDSAREGSRAWRRHDRSLYVALVVAVALVVVAALRRLVAPRAAPPPPWAPWGSCPPWETCAPWEPWKPSAFAPPYARYPR